MLVLILGVALWWVAHSFKYIAPGPRAALGDGGRALVALGVLASIVLMVIGYRMADGAFFWGRHPATVGINNLLMLVSVYLFAAAGMKTALASKMRHPMLIGLKTWALAHLLVNGDVESFILFGGLLGWAVFAMIVINRSKPDWTPPEPKGKATEIKAGVATIVIYLAIGYLHGYLGVWPYG